MVDVARQQLIDNDSFRSLPLYRCPIAEISEVAGFKPADGRYHQVIEEFSDVFKPELKQTPGTAAPSTVSTTTSKPKARLSTSGSAASASTAYKLLNELSPRWSAWVYAPKLPAHFTWRKNQDGSWRPCGDYRRFNMTTEPDPMTNISDLTTSIGTARVFSKLDLSKRLFPSSGPP